MGVGWFVDVVGSIVVDLIMDAKGEHLAKNSANDEPGRSNGGKLSDRDCR